MDQAAYCKLHTANCGTIVPKVYRLTNHEKSEKHQERAPVQGQARLNLNLKKISVDMLVIQVFFVTNIWQYHKMFVFSGL